jgi:hypothetical protein
LRISSLQVEHGFFAVVASLAVDVCFAQTVAGRSVTYLVLYGAFYRAATVVASREIVEASFALITSQTLHVRLALALTRGLVALCVDKSAFGVTVAFFAAHYWMKTIVAVNAFVFFKFVNKRWQDTLSRTIITIASGTVTLLTIGKSKVTRLAPTTLSSYNINLALALSAQVVAYSLCN